MATDTKTVTFEVEDLSLLYEAIWFYAAHKAKPCDQEKCDALLALTREVTKPQWQAKGD